MTRRFSIISVLILSLGALWIGASRAAAGTEAGPRPPAPQVGFSPPPLALATLSGDPLDIGAGLHQPTGPYLINFWASWCPPCQAEMPALQEIHTRYRDQGFTVITINQTSQDDRAAAQTLMAELGLTFPVLLDVQGEAAQAYNLRALPTTFFVGGDGVISEVVLGGPMSLAALQVRVEKLLARFPSPGAP
jgi:thiol-disulfide isomerase/thioredoxin